MNTPYNLLSRQQRRGFVAFASWVVGISLGIRLLQSTGTTTTPPQNGAVSQSCSSTIESDLNAQSDHSSTRLAGQPSAQMQKPSWSKPFVPAEVIPVLVEEVFTELSEELSSSTTFMEPPRDASPPLRTQFPVLSNHIQSATMFFTWHRRRVHRRAEKEDIWHMRGIGYAWTHHERLAVAGILPEQFMRGRNVLKLAPVVPSLRRDCASWILLVRVTGPRNGAVRAMGVASPVIPAHGEKESCFWEYTFDLDDSGRYSIDAKVLMWNKETPLLPPEVDDCSLHRGGDGTDSDPFASACCEICSRSQNCHDWKYQSEVGTTCQLALSSGNATIDLAPSSSPSDGAHPPGGPHVTTQHAEDEEGYHLVGCAWHTWSRSDHACLEPELDDAINVFPNNTFWFKPTDEWS